MSPVSARAGIVVTGTEVLTGRVSDANGPWLAERLREAGVDIGEIVVVGDRPEDLIAAIGHLDESCDLVITTGGLGPTADDLTVAVVAQARGLELHTDAALRGRIADRVYSWALRRGWDTARADLDAGIDKQALVPDGATVLEPTGTAPGLVIAAPGTPVVIVLPGPPGELRQMWADAVADSHVAALIDAADELRQSTVRIWGPPEAQLAAVLRDHDAAHDTSALEVTTCLREGELEVVTRYRPDAQASYAALETTLLDQFGQAVYSTDGRSIYAVVADLLRDSASTVATAESCTAGMLASRFADRPGSSAYLLGGFVTYSNAAKTSTIGVPADLIERAGAVSEEVSRAMADGARRELGTTFGIGITGIAGPDGGTDDKPVGLVHLCIASESTQWHRELRLLGTRHNIRHRTVVTALHLLREILGGRV